MLRECFRVLKRNGRIAGYLIHTPTGLSKSDEMRAAELGPSDVASHAPFEELTYAAGLKLLSYVDVTNIFRATCIALLKARERLEKKLRAEEGAEAYEEEQESKHSMLTGISEGLLRRAMIIGMKQ